VQDGRIVLEGPLARIAAPSGAVVVDCSDPAAAATALERLPEVTATERTASGFRLTVAGDERTATAAVARVLVAANVDVYGISPVRRTLEERFL
jgi:hypothetical protein